jgi:hypothetical protein
MSGDGSIMSRPAVPACASWKKWYGFRMVKILPRLLAYVTDSLNQELLARNEYLAAENRILRAEARSTNLFRKFQAFLFKEKARKVKLRYPPAFWRQRITIILDKISH